VTAICQAHAAREGWAAIGDGLIAEEVAEVGFEGFHGTIAVGDFGFQASQEDDFDFPGEVTDMGAGRVGPLAGEFASADGVGALRIVLVEAGEGE
jgi:hypothetical protein